jgi:hypothetical protein
MAYKLKIFNKTNPRDKKPSVFGEQIIPTKELLQQSKKTWEDAEKRIEVSGKADPVPKMWSDKKFDKMMGFDHPVRVQIKTGLDTDAGAKTSCISEKLLKNIIENKQEN